LLGLELCIVVGTFARQCRIVFDLLYVPISLRRDRSILGFDLSGLCGSHFDLGRSVEITRNSLRFAGLSALIAAYRT
jgi:hypothetical protein